MQASLPNDEIAVLRLQGINAVKAGDLMRARDLLAQTIQRNPRDEIAWLWLSGAVETDYDRQRCLERVLLLNPNNQAARQGLAQLAAARAVPATNATSPVTTAPPAAPNPQVVAQTEPTNDTVARATVLQPHVLTPLPPPIPESPPATASGTVVPLPAVLVPDPPDSLAGLRPVVQPRRLTPLLLVMIGLVCLIIVLVIVLAVRYVGNMSEQSLQSMMMVNIPRYWQK